MQDPQSVRDVLKQQWPAAFPVLALLVGVSSWWINRHVDGLLSVLACGLAIGGLLWFGLVLLAAAGWIAFFMDFED
jgi:hypothetical protein